VPLVTIDPAGELPDDPAALREPEPLDDRPDRASRLVLHAQRRREEQEGDADVRLKVNEFKLVIVTVG
jgi:hypothetical protein